MNALSRLITKVTKVQFQRATTIEEISTILDRTIAFAEGDSPYLSESQIEDIAASIPEVQPAETTPIEEETEESAIEEPTE